MTRDSTLEYAGVVRQWYLKASKKEKGAILDEFVRVTGYHRKAAVRLLLQREGERSKGRRGRAREYGPEVVAALKLVWEAADYLCAHRLKPFMPELVGVLRRHGELVLAEEVEGKLLRMSRSTMDRLLRPYRRRLSRPFSTTKPGTLLKQAIPIRTFADWDQDRPGFLEVDLVAHCGQSTEGFYLSTLSTVDVATGWTECMGVWGKHQDRVMAAIELIRRRLPFPLLGLDSDNGSEFINQGLFGYCQREKITFTRSRPYKKNDSAYVEQKNWSVVRRLIGYDRYSSREALEKLNEIYRLTRLYVNFFQPMMKLISKTREGARVRKVYDVAKTPYRRMLESQVVTAEKAEELKAVYESLNPVKLRARIEAQLEGLWSLADQQKEDVAHGREVGLEDGEGELRLSTRA